MVVFVASVCDEETGGGESVGGFEAGQSSVHDVDEEDDDDVSVVGVVFDDGG